jgi:hypothetical protein
VHSGADRRDAGGSQRARRLHRRGLDVRPELAIADGALGFWKAAGEVWPTTRRLPTAAHPFVVADVVTANNTAP